jgi:hypothetical protein
MALEHKYVIVDNDNDVVIGVQYYSRHTDDSRPMHEVKVDKDISDSNLLGYKYDMNAEYTEEKTATSFTAPSSDKYFDEEGVEQDIS